jgi:hypothetical protein
MANPVIEWYFYSETLKADLNYLNYPVFGSITYMKPFYWPINSSSPSGVNVKHVKSFEESFF